MWLLLIPFTLGVVLLFFVKDLKNRAKDITDEVSVFEPKAHSQINQLKNQTALSTALGTVSQASAIDRLRLNQMLQSGVIPDDKEFASIMGLSRFYSDETGWRQRPEEKTKKDYKDTEF